MVELLLGFLGTLPLVLHLKQSVSIPLRYAVIDSLHMMFDFFKSLSPGRRLYSSLNLVPLCTTVFWFSKTEFLMHYTYSVYSTVVFFFYRDFCLSSALSQTF